MRVDGWKDLTKLTVVFRNFANSQYNVRNVFTYGGKEEIFVTNISTNASLKTAHESNSSIDGKLKKKYQTVEINSGGLL
jgi:hypothetical protein